MATTAVSRIAVPSCTGLRADVSTKVVCKSSSVSVKSVAPRASLESAKSVAAKALVATGASLLLAFGAQADTTINMGMPGGQLVFDPSAVSVSAGEKVTFSNNEAYPHNVIFDEVPDGVDADALSHEDSFEVRGETYTVTLTKPGTYVYYCEPHLGALMKGSITVT